MVTKGQGMIVNSLLVSVAGMPYIRPMPNISAVAGEPLYVACPVAGYPIDIIIWEKGTLYYYYYYYYCSLMHSFAHF